MSSEDGKGPPPDHPFIDDEPTNPDLGGPTHEHDGEPAVHTGEPPAHAEPPSAAPPPHVPTPVEHPAGAAAEAHAEAPAEAPAQPPLHEPVASAESPAPAHEAPAIEAPGKPAWRQQLNNVGEKLKSSQWVRELGAKLQNFEPAQAAEWATQTFQKQNAGLYGKGATIALCAFFMADLMALLAGRFIPEPPVSHLNRGNAFRRPKTVEDYSVVFSRNLFNSAGIIPGEGSGPAQPNQPDLGAAPVRTSLPFTLVGTIILTDELRSIATIEDKSATAVYPVRETDEIPNKAKIVRIEPKKVTFVNTSSGRMEYIDIPEDAAPPVQPGKVSVSAPRGTPGVEKVAPNQFNVNRSEVDNALKDLNKVLTEARAVPNFENGVANGYKLFQIVPGSIYDKLGLQNGDVITGLNGTAINDPGKAFEMLSELKTSNHLELQVKKDGKVNNNIYDIR